MDIPAVNLLCLEQKDRSLEDHKREFLDLALQTHYLDSCLCTFYYVGLNTSTKAGEGPWGSFATFVEWVLVNCGSCFTIDPMENITSPTPKSGSSLPSSRCMEQLPVPTTDREPEHATTEELWSLSLMTQVQEPATLHVPEGVLVVYEGMERSLTHTPTAKGKLQRDSAIITSDVYDKDNFLYVLSVLNLLRLQSSHPASLSYLLS